MPTATPAVPVTPAPAAADRRFDSWRLDPEPREYGFRTFYTFRNTAVGWEVATQAPELIYECDSYGGRAVYIDWQMPLVTTSSTISRYTEDPFKQYRDLNLDRINEMADHLFRLVDGLELHHQNAYERDEMWRDLEEEWQIDSESAPRLIESMRRRNHRSLLITLEFFVERADPEERLRFDPLLREIITSVWVILSQHRAQMDAGALGKLRLAYKDSFPVKEVYSGNRSARSWAESKLRSNTPRRSPNGRSAVCRR